MSVSKKIWIDIYVTDMKKSIVFYESLLEEEMVKSSKGGWAFFWDSKIFLRVNINGAMNSVIGRSCIPVFYTDDIDFEHARIMELSQDISGINFMNIMSPYNYFTFKDPDDNILEMRYSLSPIL